MTSCKEKKILFIVNGYGLGNSSRCHAIISELLEQKVSVDIICSGNSLIYFKNVVTNFSGNLYEFHQLIYGKKNMSFSLLETIKLIPKNIGKMIKNKIRLFQILKKNQYHAIVIDSDYTITVSALFIRIPLIAINNSKMIIQEMWRIQKWQSFFWPQFYIELMDFVYHSLITKNIISPDLSSPIVRKELVRAKSKSKIKNVLIMLGGSEFSKDIRFLESIPDIGANYIFLSNHKLNNSLVNSIGENLNSIPLLNTADAIITNSGFSTVSECVYMNKPAIFIPIDNHVEQYVNAQIASKSKKFIMSSKKDIAKSILQLKEMIDNSPFIHEESYSYQNGSLGAANFIYELA